MEHKNTLIDSYGTWYHNQVEKKWNPVFYLANYLILLSIFDCLCENRPYWHNN